MFVGDCEGSMPSGGTLANTEVLHGFLTVGYSLRIGTQSQSMLFSEQ